MTDTWRPGTGFTCADPYLSHSDKISVRFAINSLFCEGVKPNDGASSHVQSFTILYEYSSKDSHLERHMVSLRVMTLLYADEFGLFCAASSACDTAPATWASGVVVQRCAKAR